LNDLTAGEIKASIEKFNANGRPSSAASAIRQARAKNPVAAQGKAGLHNPDLVIGGSEAVEDFGGMSENSSLGAQNRARQQQIYDAVKDKDPNSYVRFRFSIEKK